MKTNINELYDITNALDTEAKKLISEFEQSVEIITNGRSTSMTAEFVMFKKRKLIKELNRYTDILYNIQTESCMNADKELFHKAKNIKRYISAEITRLDTLYKGR